MILIELPPNFEQIKSAFPGAGNAGVLFAYDGNIYNPSGNRIPDALIAHESVHLKRQEKGDRYGAVISMGYGGADFWWKNYIEDSEFRYHEELLAHVAEFRAQRDAYDRNLGARLLVSTALRLIAPLYNYQPPRTLQQAIKDLKREI